MRLSRDSQLLALVLGCWAVLSLGAGIANAHPLGNTSVNVYERVEIKPESIFVRYVLDVSEIPALKEKEFADTNDDGTVDGAEADAYLDGLWVYVQPKLRLDVGSSPLPLTLTDQTLSFPPGQGGLTLMRAVFDLSAPHPTSPAGAILDATLSESTFEGVPGWHEIIVQATAGATVVESSVAAEDLTDELTAYPPDRLDDPLSIREATFRYALDEGTVAPSPTLTAAGPSGGPTTTPTSPEPTRAPEVSVPGSGRPDDPLVALVGADVSPLAALGGVAIALALGAFHALSPGHGKTLVAAYLIGTRADLRQALGLGMTVAATHTAGVLLLGVATYFATEWIVPDRIVRWLSLATGILVVLLGGILAWRAWRMWSGQAVHEHGHDHGHDHGPAGTHRSARGSAEGGRRRGRRSREVPSSAVAASPMLRHRDVAALGVVGGLIPSGSALLLLLSSVALGQTALGVVLILAFGMGMALVLAGISTGIVLMRRSPLMGWERWRDPRLGRLARLIPVGSGVVVLGFGSFLTFEALRTLY